MWSKISRHTFWDGADTLASARPHGCSPTWRHGSAEGYVRIFGGNGKTAPTASKNYDGVACRSSMRRLPPVRRPGSGACPDIRRSNRPCATRISTASVSPASMFLLKLNPIEPPWYGPVCPVVWEGRHREGSPYPDPCPIPAIGRSPSSSDVGGHKAVIGTCSGPCEGSDPALYPSDCQRAPRSVRSVLRGATS